MDKMLKKELGLSRLAILAITLGLAGLMTLSVIFCVYLYSSTEKSVKKQAIRRIVNISQLNKESVSRPIWNRRTLLQMFALRMEEEDMDDIDEILSMLESYRIINDFYSMGVVTRDKTLYLTNGIVADLSDDEKGMCSWDGQFCFTESYRPYAGGKYQVNAFTYPVYYDGELRYVLFATYLSVNITERMNLSSMEGKGFNFLINTDGEVVIYPHYYENEEYNALMKYINDTPSVKPEGGTDCYFDYNGERYYAHFEELGINEWLLMTCAREADVFSEAYVLIHNSFMSICLLWVVIAIAAFSIVYSVYRSRRELRKSFFTMSFLISEMKMR